jgi:hypothetical protein
MSAARIIQSAITERLQAFPFFANFKFRRNQSYQVQPTDLPYCGIYQLPEQQVSDGDPNAGEPRLKSETLIGISVILPNINPDELEDTLDVAFDIIMVGLLQDPSFIGFPPAGQYDIESVPKVRRQMMFGNVGSTNETPIGELRVEMTFITKYDYPPDIHDQLELIHLETAYPSLEKAGSIQQVVAQWDLRSVESGGDSPDKWDATDQDRDYEWPVHAAGDSPGQYD